MDEKRGSVWINELGRANLQGLNLTATLVPQIHSLWGVGYWGQKDGVARGVGCVFAWPRSAGLEMSSGPGSRQGSEEVSKRTTQGRQDHRGEFTQR